MMAKTEKKLIANNKKAYHDFFLEERYEAGIELHGTEVDCTQYLVSSCHHDMYALS